MGKCTQPILKRCKALGINPVVMGYDKQTKRDPKGNVRRKKSEYGIQLNEKQKVKFIYGMLEKQFRLTYDRASKMAGSTGENFLQLLELRLDNVIFRMGFAKTRNAARQMVSHGHIQVNGKKVDIPSYQVKLGDVISVCEASQNTNGIKESVSKDYNRKVPQWLEVNSETFSAKVLSLPTKADIDYEVEEHLIVEFYSR